MKIKRIRIFNYGKWHHVTIPLKSNLNVIYGKNEAGKTTLMSFIKGVLFGYLQRRSSHKNYIPKGAADYGGQLEIEADHHDYIVQRKSGKHNGQLTVMDSQGRQLDGTVLKQLLGPFDRNTFDSLYYFGTVNLRAVTKLKRKDLIYRIQRIGMSHSNDWINYQGTLVKRAKKLFSPTGYKPPLNQKLKRYTKLMDQVREAQAGYGDYQDLLSQVHRIQPKRRAVNNELKAIDNRLDRLRRDRTEWLQYRKLQELRPVIGKSIRPGFTDTDEQHLRRMVQQINKITDEIRFAKQRLVTTKQGLVHDNRISLYQKHRKRIDSLMNRSNKIGGLIQNLKLLKSHRTNLVKQLNKIQSSKPVDHRIISDGDYRSMKHRKVKIDHQLPLIDQLITRLKSRLKTPAGSRLDKGTAGLVIRIMLIMLSTVIGMWKLSIVQHNLNQQYQVRDRLAKLNKQIKRSTAIVSKYFKAWSFISPRASLNVDDLDRLNQLRTLTGRLSRFVETNRKTRDQVKAIKATLDSNQRVRDELNQKLRKFYQRRHVQGRDGFDKENHRQETLLRQRQTYHELSKQFGASELTALKRYSSLDDLKASVTEDTQRENRLQTEGRLLAQKLTSVQVKLHHLVHNGSYDELKQRAANARATIDNLSARWFELKLASQWIDATLNLATKDRVPKIKQRAQTNFELLTNGRYESILFNKTQIKVMRVDKRRFTLYELSKGTVQQLYLALIFAMAQVFGSDYPMPVLIDDGFTDFDVDRKKAALKLLNSVSQRLQVIYCTSDRALANQPRTVNLGRL